MSRKVVALSLLGLVLLLAQQPGKAQSSPPNALPFFKNYFITGDYRVGSVDLSNPVGNFATGDIHFNNALGNAVPANADIVAAFLYWEMITLAPRRPSLSGRTIPRSGHQHHREAAGSREASDAKRLRRAGPAERATYSRCAAISRRRAAVSSRAGRFKR